MCLYETKIKNPHYLPNEKNGGIPPTLTDKRLEYVGVGCGWCKECRKAKARNWQIRLTEEYKSNKECEFVTLSFSPKAIQQLEEEIYKTNYKELNGNELDVNILASFAIRKYQERWRKKYKRAQKHWFVTEIGHTNSERIHLHGLVWKTHELVTKEQFQKDIKEKWGYGNVYIGQWVDERTINYITKYLTKNDAQHEGYKPRTFVSKGLGESYLNKGQYINHFQGDNTNTQYRLDNGTTVELPRYYKDKLYTQQQKEEIWKNKLDKNEEYLNGSKWDKTDSDQTDIREQWERALEAERRANKRAGYSDNEQSEYKYIVTEKMKAHKDDKILNEKITQKVRRRANERKEDNTAIEEIGKTWGIKRIVSGQYIGTTTAGERKRNEEIATAREMKIDVRTLRLIRKGVIEM